MGDTKKGREKQADDEAKRQRKRDLEEALDRGEEVEPERDDADQLGEFDEALETHDYPTTTHELIESYGDREVESQSGTRTIADVLEPIDDETYGSADGVRRRVLSQLRR